MVCTFLGNRITPDTIRPILRETLVDLIENKNVDRFYIGDGHFDFHVKAVLKELKKIYDINYYVVLAYLPKKDSLSDYSDAIFPRGINKFTRKYRIVSRNKWMIENSDYVVTHIRNTKNSSAFKEVVEKLGKIVINILV